MKQAHVEIVLKIVNITLLLYLVYCYTINDRMESFHEVIDEIVPHNHYDKNPDIIYQNSGCVNDATGSNVCEREGQPIKIYVYDKIWLKRCTECPDESLWKKVPVIQDIPPMGSKEYLEYFYNSSSKIYNVYLGEHYFIPSYHVINSRFDIWFNYSIHSNSKIYSKKDLTDKPRLHSASITQLAPTQLVPKIKYLYNDGTLEDSGQSYFP